MRESTSLFKFRRWGFHIWNVEVFWTDLWTQLHGLGVEVRIGRRGYSIATGFGVRGFEFRKGWY
jgi:hypothetical protein